MVRFQKIKVSDHMLVINKNGINWTVTVPRETLTDGKHNASELSSSSSLFALSQAKEPDSKEVPIEYAVDHIIGH